ncbi:hypothetical protein AB6A40_005801 [Gnathostoma spinigerum]|uniref:C2H2-type domain-containing protein n=1 Tax=Gnathostoma spinigerum TaxID=75299 RepID=A0ABD6EIP9_9BILA
MNAATTASEFLECWKQPSESLAELSSQLWLPMNLPYALPFPLNEVEKLTDPSSSSWSGHLLGMASINVMRYNESTGKVDIAGLRCQKCAKAFFSRKDLIEHIAGCQRFKFECKRCSRVFVSEKRMRAHEDNKHSVQAKLRSSEPEVKAYSCERCDRTYETFYNFKEHLAKHEGKIFQCSICHKKLSGQSSLSRHSKIHAKPHQCLVCASRFSSAYDLDCHFSYYHSVTKRFKCDHCDRVLYNYSGKLRHERLCASKQSTIEKNPTKQTHNHNITKNLRSDEQIQRIIGSSMVVSKSTEIRKPFSYNSDSFDDRPKTSKTRFNIEDILGVVCPPN